MDDKIARGESPSMTRCCWSVCAQGTRHGGAGYTFGALAICTCRLQAEAPGRQEVAEAHEFFTGSETVTVLHSRYPRSPSSPCSRPPLPLCL